MKVAEIHRDSFVDWGYTENFTSGWGSSTAFSTFYGTCLWCFCKESISTFVMTPEFVVAKGKLCKIPELILKFFFTSDNLLGQSLYNWKFTHSCSSRLSHSMNQSSLDSAKTPNTAEIMGFSVSKLNASATPDVSGLLLNSTRSSDSSRLKGPTPDSHNSLNMTNSGGLRSAGERISQIDIADDTSILRWLFYSNKVNIMSTLWGDKVSMLTHTYPHTPLRKIEMTICSHQA